MFARNNQFKSGISCFVLGPRGTGKTAIEVKRKRNITSHDLNGMRAFASDYPEAKKIVFYGGDHEEMIDGIKLVPIMKALPVLESIIWPK